MRYSSDKFKLRNNWMSMYVSSLSDGDLSSLLNAGFHFKRIISYDNRLTHSDAADMVQFGKISRVGAVKEFSRCQNWDATFPNLWTNLTSRLREHCNLATTSAKLWKWCFWKLRSDTSEVTLSSQRASVCRTVNLGSVCVCVCVCVCERERERGPEIDWRPVQAVYSVHDGICSSALQPWTGCKGLFM